jgi:hypothetical protein
MLDWSMHILPQYMLPNASRFELKRFNQILFKLSPSPIEFIESSCCTVVHVLHTKVYACTCMVSWTHHGTSMLQQYIKAEFQKNHFSNWNKYNFMQFESITTLDSYNDRVTCVVYLLYIRDYTNHIYIHTTCSLKEVSNF